MEYPKGNKRCADSLTEITKFIQYRDVNGQDRLFGGRLLRGLSCFFGIKNERALHSFARFV